MITITPRATEKLMGLMRAQNAIGILITVESGGCSGIRYSLSYEMEHSDGQKEFSCGSIKFFYDPNDEAVIDGLDIDLVEHDFGQGFSVTNKRHTSCQHCSCGCKTI
ncbi:MAG: iron-sulfur cluster assembly accessory protein [Holosporales bacterium]|nr:iron-sulfur cluster assembly accessory protein [Holosporales bacterium]